MQSPASVLIAALISVGILAGACGGSNRYSVGGTVSGLNGTMVLKNNGGDDLTITADGPFNFATELEKFGLYNITVSAAPLNQVCDVGAGLGQVLEDPVTNVTVTCTIKATASKSWNYPENFDEYISPSVSGSVQFKPQVAMDSSGNSIIAWCQYDGTTSNGYYFSEYRNGSWTHPAYTGKINKGSTGCDSEPSVAMDDDGNAIITWSESDGGNTQIFKSEYRSGTWTHPSSLTDNISPDGQDAHNPRVAMDNNGNAVITWYQSNGTRDQIYRSEYRSGAWNHPTNLSSDNISVSSQAATNPVVTMDNNNNAVIAWLQSNGTNNMVYRSEYRGGAWTHPSNLATDNVSPSGQNCAQVTAAMDDNGNALIVWVQVAGANVAIFKSEYRNSSWSNPTSLTDNISPDGQDAEHPNVAMDNLGNAAIVWDQSDGSFTRIYLAEYRAGSWDIPTSLTENRISPDLSHSEFPVIAMDNLGNAIVQWDQFTVHNGYSRIFKSEYRDGSWKHPKDVNDFIKMGALDNHNQFQGTVAMSDNGEAVMSWFGFETDNVNTVIFMADYR